MGRKRRPREFLKLGSGLYIAEGKATITSDRGSAVCTANGYVKFDGGKVIQAAAAGVALVGGTTALFAKGAPKKDVTTTELGADLDRDIKRDVPGLDPYSTPIGMTPVRSSFCCMIAMMMVPLLALGTVGGGGAVAPDAGSSGGSRTFRKKGHAIIGTIGGLLFGLGLTVAIQQQGIWVLDIWTGIALPVVLAVLAGIRARRGILYRAR